MSRRSFLFGFSLGAVTSLLFVSFSFTSLGDGRFVRPNSGKVSNVAAAAAAAAAAVSSIQTTLSVSISPQPTARADSATSFGDVIQLPTVQLNISSNESMSNVFSNISSFSIPRLLQRPLTISKRPRRSPPKWLQEGICTPPKGWEENSHSNSAVGSFLDEKTNEQLLGDCNCPLKSKPSDFSFDCGLYDWRILTDLAPWHGVNISHEALDLSFTLSTGNIPPGYHFSINKGKIYMRQQGPLSSYHDKILAMLITVATLVDLPDVEFALHPWDHAKVWRQDPIPVFSFIRDIAKNDITVPYPYRWEGNGLGTSRGSSCLPWEDRENRVMWRGGCTGPVMGYRDELWSAYIRYRAGIATASQSDILDAGLIEKCSLASNGTLSPLASINLDANACRYKALLLLDGNTASGRSSLWVHQGAVLLKPDSVFSEWYYHLLQPWVHYVPVREFLEDLEEQANWVTREATPAALLCLRKNLEKLAIQHVNREAIACYWWRLLTTWKKQQPQESRTQGFDQVN